MGPVSMGVLGHIACRRSGAGFAHTVKFRGAWVRALTPKSKEHSRSVRGPSPFD